MPRQHGDVWSVCVCVRHTHPDVLKYPVIQHSHTQVYDLVQGGVGSAARVFTDSRVTVYTSLYKAPVHSAHIHIFPYIDLNRNQ